MEEYIFYDALREWWNGKKEKRLLFLFQTKKLKQGRKHLPSVQSLDFIFGIFVIVAPIFLIVAEIISPSQPFTYERFIMLILLVVAAVFMALFVSMLTPFIFIGLGIIRPLVQGIATRAASFWVFSLLINICFGTMLDVLGYILGRESFTLVSTPIMAGGLLAVATSWYLLYFWALLSKDNKGKLEDSNQTLDQHLLDGDEDI